MSDATIDRINALTSNARSTWLGLFSVLVFAVVTLVRIEHIDFYGVDRGTQLPLVNITVPTYIFFYAAPILIFAIYGYLHLYLIRLWDALSVAPPWIGRTRLGEAVSPWLITDAALSLREILRRDGCAKRRETDYTSMILNFVISWLSGPFILGWIWCQSMPARDLWMTSLGGLMFAGSLAMGSVSLRLLFTRMRHKDRPQPNFGRITAIYFSTLSVFAALILILTWGRTMEPLFPRDIVNPQGEIVGQTHWIPLADIDLQDQRLTERPSGWLPYTIARKEALASWCKREPVDDCANLTDNEDDDFNKEWQIKRTAQINDLRKPTHLNDLKQDDVKTKSDIRHIPDDFPDLEWTSDTELEIEVNIPDLRFPRRALDLRDADLRGAFLAGANLTAATLSGADAQYADLEGAELTYADLVETDLIGANLTNADLWRAQLQGAYLNLAQLQGADLGGAQLQGAYLERAQLRGAYFERAQLQGAHLTRAQLQGTNLQWSQLQEAHLPLAQLQGANLQRALLQGADLRWAQLQGADLRGAQLQGADLQRALLQGAHLPLAQLQGADLSLSLVAGADEGPWATTDTDLSASTNNGGAMRSVDLTPARFDHETDWRTVFLDASVSVSPDFRRTMEFPCQWVWAETAANGAPLPDENFFAMWRGWASHLGREHFWTDIAPPEWRDVAPIAPPDWCRFDWDAPRFTRGR